MDVVADTSALVSLGTVADRDPNPLDVLLDEHTVLVPERVVEELESTAAYDDASGEGATAVLDRASAFEMHEVELDDTFPLDEGENAAVTLANARDAAQFLCDEFTRIALSHASLADTRLVTTPILLVAFVRNGRLDADAATELLSVMSEARSWSQNAYVARARELLDRQ